MPLLGFGFAANESFIAAHPDVLKRFLIAMKKGFAEAQRDPKTACEFMQATVHLPGSIATCVDYSEGLWKLSTPATDPDWGRQSPEEWQKLVATLQRVGELPEDAKAATFYTNDFVP